MKGKATLKGKKPGVKQPPAPSAAPPGPAEKRSAEPPLNKGRQIELFDQAMKRFRASDYPGAAALFQQVANGPSRDVAYSARVHLSVSERRMAKPEPTLATPTDHYHYAIALINRRELGAALDHLQQALGGQRNGDHVHYALALCYGLKGDIARAAEHLKRAIEIEPRNRAAAADDPDFRRLVQEPRIRELLYPERESSG